MMQLDDLRRRHRYSIGICIKDSFLFMYIPIGYKSDAIKIERRFLITRS